MAEIPSKNLVEVDKIVVALMEPMVTVIRKSKALKEDRVLFPEVLSIIIIEI